MYYIAYGSNMNTEAFNKLAKDNVLVGKFLLNGYKLILNKYLSIKKTDKKEDYVPVVLYEVSEDDIEKIDEYEDIKNNLYYKAHIELKFNKQPYICLVYLMTDISKHQKATEEYEKVCYDAYLEHDFDTRLLNEVFKKTEH